MLDNINDIIVTAVRTIAAHGLADVSVPLSQVSLLVSLTFAGVLTYIAVKRRELATATRAVADTGTPSAPVAAPGALRGRWQDIATHLDSARENDWKLAVLEGDKLVDVALRDAGFPGDTFGDRLTNIQAGALVSLDGLWWAHRVRNRVAHEMDYFLRYTEARQAVSYYEAVLSELRLL